MGTLGEVRERGWGHWGDRDSGGTGTLGEGKDRGSGGVGTLGEIGVVEERGHWGR